MNPLIVAGKAGVRSASRALISKAAKKTTTNQAAIRVMTKLGCSLISEGMRLVEKKGKL